MIHHLSDHLLHSAQNWDCISMCLDLEGLAAAEDKLVLSPYFYLLEHQSLGDNSVWLKTWVNWQEGKTCCWQHSLSEALIAPFFRRSRHTHTHTHYPSRSWHWQDSLSTQLHPLLPAISSLPAISWLPAISIAASTICHQQRHLPSTQQHYFICRHQHVAPLQLVPPNFGARSLFGGHPTCTIGPTYLWALPSACVDIGNHPCWQGLLPAGRRQNRAISIRGDVWQKAGKCSKTAGMGGIQNSQQWAWACGNNYMALTAYTRELKCRFCY